MEPTRPQVRRARTESGELAPGWDLTFPAFGFGAITVTTYPTWRAAHQALGTAAGTAGPVLERHVAGYSAGASHRSRGPARPRWIDTRHT